MCIIIYKPENIVLPDATLKNCWENNPHGAGFMFTENSTLQVVKGLMTWEEFLSAYRKYEPTMAMVLHFRIKTHGKVIPELTHPFMLKDGKTAMAHNGVIHKLTKLTDENNSDSKVFADHIGTTFGNNLQKALDHDFIRFLLASVSDSSKFVFMENTGKVWILNGHLGVEADGCWYSNYSFKDYSAYQTWEREWD